MKTKDFRAEWSAVAASSNSLSDDDASCILGAPTDFQVPAEITLGGSTCPTEYTVSSLETSVEIETAKPSLKGFSVGDHVYTWCSLLGVSRAYQHHGIVIQVTNHYVKIIDFYPIFDMDDDDEANVESGANKTSISKGVGGSLTSSGRHFSTSTVVLDHETANKEWKRVEYNVAWTERLLRRSGTCSPVIPDTVGFVLSRIDFLKENSHVLPRYDELQSNCECVAVWCKTGRYCSLQGTALLGGLAKGSIKATAIAGAGVSTATISVPCAGVWGWLGYTTTVPLVTAVPILIPAIIVGGVAAFVPPILVLQRCKKEWNDVTELLNDCLAQACRQGQYLPHSPTYQSL
jgi:hypothetical protein